MYSVAPIEPLDKLHLFNFHLVTTNMIAPKRCPQMRCYNVIECRISHTGITELLTFSERSSAERLRNTTYTYRSAICYDTKKYQNLLGK